MLSPENLRKFYDYLCEECRYEWVYETERIPPRCEICKNRRFDERYLNIQLIYIKYETHDIKHNTCNIISSVDFLPQLLGPALLLVAPRKPNMSSYHPAMMQTLEMYLQRTKLIFGRVMSITSKYDGGRFIGFNMVDYEPNIQYHYYLIGRTPSSN